MATPDIDARLLTAGREYGDALASLGLDPHALFWAFDKTEQRHILVLVTDFFDYTGPLEISKQLFRAYNASVTPQEIDPFVVRIHSIHQPVGEEYRGFMEAGGKFKIWDRNMVEKPVPPEARIETFTVGDLELRPSWSIRVRKSPPRKSVELGRNWRRFVRNLEHAAA